MAYEIRSDTTDVSRLRQAVAALCKVPVGLAAALWFACVDALTPDLSHGNPGAQGEHDLGLAVDRHRALPQDGTDALADGFAFAM